MFQQQRHYSPVFEWFDYWGWNLDSPTTEKPRRRSYTPTRNMHRNFINVVHRNYSRVKEVQRLVRTCGVVGAVVNPVAFVPMALICWLVGFIEGDINEFVVLDMSTVFGLVICCVLPNGCGWILNCGNCCEKSSGGGALGGGINNDWAWLYGDAVCPKAAGFDRPYVVENWPNCDRAATWERNNNSSRNVHLLPT